MKSNTFFDTWRALSNGVSKSRLHYAWVIAAVTFLVLLMTAGIRATPGILIVPLEQEFGWSRAIISLSVAINIALFGLIGPFAASVMDRLGLRRIVLAAIALLIVAVALSTRMHAQWQLMLLWGVLVGVGTGVTSMVLAAVVATRWFDEQRGLVLGALSAANATGQLVFLPALAKITESSGWRSATLVVAAAGAAIFVVVLLFMRDRPEDIGLLPYGAVPWRTLLRMRHWRRRGRWRRLRRCVTRWSRARSGFSRARSSYAARAQTG